MMHYLREENQMQMFNAHVEVQTRDVDVDASMAALEPFHGVLGSSDRGWVSARVSVPAESIAQAAAAAAAVVSQALGADAIVVEVMTESEFDAREGWSPAPVDVLSITETAALLGISRQSVHKAIGDHRLQAAKVGNVWQVSRGSAEAYRVRT